MDLESLHCDVLVIGGGAAASRAAVEAAGLGAKVLVCDRGRVGRGGSSFTCGGGTAAAFGHSQADGPERHAAETLERGGGINSPELVEVLAKEAPGEVAFLESIGLVYAKTPEGLYRQNRGLGQLIPRNCTPKGNGAALVKALVKEAAWRGARFLDRVRAVKLLSLDGRAVGAACLDLSGQRSLAIEAKAVVLAAGSATGLYPGSSAAYPGFGDAFRMGSDLGLKLANMEFLEFTFVPVVGGRLTSVGGSTQLTDRGAGFVNALGQDLRTLHDIGPTGLTRAAVTKAIWLEEKAGRGPVSLDLTPITEAAWREWESAGHPFLAFLKAANGSDRRRAKIPLAVALHCHLGGLPIDPWGQTAAPGLLAAGETATGLHGALRLGGNAIAECLVFGRRAGLAAARLAGSAKDPKARVWESLARDGIGQAIHGLAGPKQTSPEKIEKLIAQTRDLAGETLGPVREAGGLTKAVREFERLLDLANSLSTGRIGPLGRLLDLRGLALTGLLSAQAALARKESLGVHFRSDSPHLAPGEAG
ncbi:MAG: FAD-binding protein [Deltaproteobacteria bacterium]|jgi:fumarate reductase (CoM/CoB) subunit A|nr:FAD-binding protein [Deltaproteobacteria bacterium]